MSTIKHSIFKQIITVFVIAILLATIVAGVFSFLYSFRATVTRSARYARTGGLSAAQVIESIDYDKLKESNTSELYVKIRKELRNICQSCGLEYLYLYEVEPDEESIRFIIAVATDDEKDEDIIVERALGVVVPWVLTEQERAVLFDEEYTRPYIEDNVFGKVYTWYYPVYDDNGDIIALIGSDYSTNAVLRNAAHITVVIVLCMTAVFLLVFLIALLPMYRRIFAPIKLISYRMRGFVTDSGTNLEPLHIHSEDEIQEIADSFEKMSEDIANYLDRIEQLTTERVQKNVEMEVAGKIQNGIVPAETVLNDGSCAVYANAKPAKEVGGDFYDCFKNRDGNICVVIGDVSGKGFAAAMFMVMTKTMIRDCLLSGMNPADALNVVNSALCDSNPEGMFATAFAATLDPCSGLLHYANAGHTRPVIIQGSAELMNVDPGIALGLFEDADIADYSLQMEKSSCILIYTDGVTEAVNTQNQFFGEKRLLSAVGAGGDGAGHIVKALDKAVHDFTESAEQFDDYTVLALYYRGVSMQTLQLKPEHSSLPQLRDAVMQAADGGLGSKKIYLACEEVFANIADYSGATAVEVTIAKQNNRLTVKFADDGDSFNPLEAEPIEKDFEELDSGGMGISLVRQLADTLDYKRTDNRNVLTLGFVLEPYGDAEKG